MATYTVNSVGSTSMNIPSTLVVNDVLRFNITNSSTSNPYLGYYLTYTFPFNCSAQIQAYGARGSYGNLYTYGASSTARSGSGAYVTGTFDFKKGDILLMAIGQLGKDAMTSTSSTKDQTTGAGGGATTIAKKVSSSNYYFNGISNNNSTQYAGWYVEPLIVAAGGNGSRDNGYSGTGTIYGGQGYTDGSAESLGSTSYVGGAFSREQGNVSSNSSSYTYGRCFLNGNLGSMYYYTRSTYAMAGFGGGAANVDDGDGGGGGGWIPGYRGSAAKSFCSTTGTNRSYSSDYNAGQGYVLITIKAIKAGVSIPVKINGTWKESNGVYIKVNNAWKEVNGVYVKANGSWKSQ